MRKAELKTAYCWTCEDCGTKNFESPRKVEFTLKSKEEAYRQWHELAEWESLPDSWQDFETAVIPDQVTCCQCEEVFGTVDERDGLELE